jgi:hypothetical protein
MGDNNVVVVAHYLIDFHLPSIITRAKMREPVEQKKQESHKFDKKHYVEFYRKNFSNVPVENSSCINTDECAEQIDEINGKYTKTKVYAALIKLFKNICKSYRVLPPFANSESAFESVMVMLEHGSYADMTHMKLLDALRADSVVVMTDKNYNDLKGYFRSQHEKRVKRACK